MNTEVLTILNELVELKQKIKQATITTHLSGLNSSVITDVATVVVREATVIERMSYFVLHKYPAKLIRNSILSDLRNNYDPYPKYLHSLIKDNLKLVPTVIVEIFWLELDDEQSNICCKVLGDELNLPIQLNGFVAWETNKEYSLNQLNKELENAC